MNLDALAEMKTHEYLEKHREMNNCEVTVIEADWYNLGLENGYYNGFLAGARENNTIWHDTRHATCIEDYPQDKDKLYAFKVNKAKYEKDPPMIEYMIGSSDDCYYEAMMHKVIAWCSLPKFEEPLNESR